MGITGKRRLIFGLFSVLTTALVEMFATGGWSMYGHLALIAIAGFYYGNSAVDKKANGSKPADKDV